MLRGFKFGLLAGLLLGLVGCTFMLRTKEVLEGSEVWIQELTRGMTITAHYPEGEVPLHRPYDLVITIENHGKYEPHLNTAIVEVLEGPGGLTCTMVEPEPWDKASFPSGLLFYLPPKKVARNTVTTLRIQCAFAQPGTYKLLLTAEFRESGKDFVSRVFSVTAR